MFCMKLIFRFRYLFPVLAVLFLFACDMPEKSFDKGMQAYEREDYEAAQQEWHPLAEQGHAKAQYNLGNMYYHGEGVPRDFEQAVKWYTKAAEQGGDGTSHYNLVYMYESGRGVTQNYQKAVKWYRKGLKNMDLLFETTSPSVTCI